MKWFLLLFPVLAFSQVTFDGVRTCSISEAEWTCSAVVSTPPTEPPTTEPDPFEGCDEFDSGAMYECQNIVVDPHTGYSEEIYSDEWRIYRRLSGDVPPTNPEPPTDPTDPTPGPGPNPNPTPPQTSSDYLGIPDYPTVLKQTVADTDYTHWIHYSQDPQGCSDAGNGSPGSPRCSIPTVLAAGSIVQIRGGPYSAMKVRVNGTADNMIFFQGPTGGKVALVGREGLDITGSHAIFRNLDLNRIQMEGPNHIMIRDSYIHDVNTGGMIGLTGHNIVFLLNEVTRNGVPFTKKDRHGFNIFGSPAQTNNIWILENNIHHNGGDGIQFCHGCVGEGNGGPGAIYIANNKIHQDKENAIDLKEFTGPVIISGNDMHGYFRITSGQGETIRVNDEGDQGELWIIDNDIHDSNVCIGPKGSDAQSYAVDNRCDRNNFGIGNGLTDQAGNLTNGVVDDANVERLYIKFQQRYGLDIRP